MDFFKDTVKYLRKNPLLIVLIVVGSITMLMNTLFDGFYGCWKETCGLIVGQNFKDTLQHLSVSGTSFKTLPFNSAIYAGENLQGYHYLPNLLIYLLNLVGIPTTVSFFQILPLIYVILLPFLAIPFARYFNKSPVFVGLFLFFCYFGSTFSYLVSFIRLGHIWQDAVMVPLMDSARVFRSIHFGYSVLMILGIFLILQRKTHTLAHVFYIAILIFLTMGTKFYGAVIAVFIVGLYETIQLVKTRNWKRFIGYNLLYSVAAVAAIFAFYDPLNATASGDKFMFAPFSIVHHIIEDPKIFYNQDLLNARYFLQQSGGLSPRLLGIELYTTALFVFYYFGMRIVGFVSMAYRALTRKMNVLEAILAASIVFSIIISLISVQSGDWFNVIQFMAYGTFFIGFYSAYVVYDLWHKSRLAGIVLGGAILLLTFIPNIKMYFYPFQERYVIPQNEYQALKDLRAYPFGSVLVFPLKSRGSYHSAIAQKPVYFYTSHINVYRNWSLDYKAREKQMKEVRNVHPEVYQVDYIYILKSDEDAQGVWTQLQKEPKMYEMIIENPDVVIYRKK